MASNARENRFKDILQTLSEGIALNQIIFNNNKEMVDYRIIEVNDAYYHQTGLKKGSKVIGSLATELYGLNTTTVNTFWKTHLTATQPVTLDYVSPISNRIFTVTISPFKENEFVTTFQDITEQKRTIESLRESEAKYRQLYESIRDAIITIDNNGTIMSANTVFLDMLGYTLEELRNLNFRTITPKKWIELEEGPISRQISEKGYADTYEKEYYHKNGSIIPVEISVYSLKNESNHIMGMWAIVRDISKRKRTEKALKESEERFRKLLQNHPSLAVQGYGMDGITHYWNKASEYIYGYTANEAIGKSLYNLIIPEEMQENVKQAIHQMAETKQPIPESELSLKRKDGSRVSVFSSHAIVTLPNKTVELFCFDIDISERKLAEDRIKSLLAEKELILKEVHHRIKNNMNTIYGLLILQAGTLNDPVAITALEDAGNRVQSMALLYEKLYQTTDFKNLSVADYLNPLIDDIVSNFPNYKLIKIEKHIDDFMIKAKNLQPLGIIINELLTNIMKYAFIGRSDGSITVLASLTENHVTLIIADNGNGMPESVNFDNSTGFGLILVNALTQQLEGTIRIERGQGTKVILEFEK